MKTPHNQRPHPTKFDVILAVLKSDYLADGIDPATVDELVAETAKRPRPAGLNEPAPLALIALGIKMMIDPDYCPWYKGIPGGKE